MRYENPIDLNIKVDNVKHVKNAGILLNYQSDNIDFLKETVSNNIRKQLSHTPNDLLLPLIHVSIIQ